ncbi:MAG TPA: hypothetical protein PK264_05700 [Hyphomicrobiaceae bacterium]|nr:hypothetical protein [Hyphomicrobiaceae bacterium]
MQLNWQLPASAHPAPGSAILAADDAPSRAAGGHKVRRRTGFQYWLIFSVCLFVLLWAGLVERLNPLFWVARRPDGNVQPLWAASKETAHRCTSLAFGG